MQRKIGIIENPQLKRKRKLKLHRKEEEKLHDVEKISINTNAHSQGTFKVPFLFFKDIYDIARILK